MHTTNYVHTFIAVAEDCPAESEVLLQAFSLRPFPNLRADASNRLRIEIND